MQTLTLPKSGKTVDEGIVLEWLVEEGDEVSEGEPIVLFESEKMSSEITAESDGVLLERLVKEGETVPVGTELGYVGQTDESPPDEEAGPTVAADPDPDQAAETPSPSDTEAPEPFRATPSARRAARERGVLITDIAASTNASHLTRDHVESYVAGASPNQNTDVTESQPPNQATHASASSVDLDSVNFEQVANPEEGDILGSPWARVLASNHGVSISAVGEAEETTRVRAADVESYVEQTASGSEVPSTEAQERSGTTSAKPDTGRESTSSAGEAEAGDSPAIAREDPIAGTAGVMFDRMSRVTNEYASTTTVARVDVSDLLDLYDRLAEAWTEADTDEESSLSLTAFIVRAVGQTLPKYEALNAEVTDDESLRIYEDVNVGIAVNTDGGLLVPTVYDAGDRSVRALSVEIDRLAADARTHSLAREDLENGTFTVSNAGSLGAYINTPQINPPQTAILGMCTIFEDAGVVDGEVVPRKMMHLTLTYDHRVVEGAIAVGFLQEVRSLLETPESLLS